MRFTVVLALGHTLEGATAGPVTLTVWEDNQSSGEGGTPPKMNIVEIPLVLAD